MIVTDNPLCFNNKPKEAEAIPFPKEESTPPEMNINLVFFTAMIICCFYIKMYFLKWLLIKREGDPKSM